MSSLTTGSMSLHVPHWRNFARHSPYAAALCCVYPVMAAFANIGTLEIDFDEDRQEVFSRESVTCPLAHHHGNVTE